VLDSDEDEGGGGGRHETWDAGDELGDGFETGSAGNVHLRFHPPVGVHYSSCAGVGAGTAGEVDLHVHSFSQSRYYSAVLDLQVFRINSIKNKTKENGSLLVSFITRTKNTKSHGTSNSTVED